ncbi:MAG TPA: CHRD domain-containing protein [Candidatus Acidoferrum sp.]|nr:CHRD domain-containing protein [Candidatus Acidoferrum sp.]
MMKRFVMVAVAVFAVALALTQPVMAADQFGARLRGLEEVPSISTPGQGFFLGTLNAAGTALDYTVVYFDLQGIVTQSHIHIAQPGVNGGIVLFFCTNLAPPAGVPVPPACPTGPGINTVNGTLTGANVITQTAQGIAAGEFGEVVRAMRAGHSYANVHTDLFPGGEIRGQITQ